MTTIRAIQDRKVGCKFILNDSPIQHCFNIRLFCKYNIVQISDTRASYDVNHSGTRVPKSGLAQ